MASMMKGCVEISPGSEMLEIAWLKLIDWNIFGEYDVGGQFWVARIGKEIPCGRNGNKTAGWFGKKAGWIGKLVGEAEIYSVGKCSQKLEFLEIGVADVFERIGIRCLEWAGYLKKSINDDGKVA